MDSPKRIVDLARVRSPKVGDSNLGDSTGIAGVRGRAGPPSTNALREYQSSSRRRHSIEQARDCNARSHRSAFAIGSHERAADVEPEVERLEQRV